MHKILTINIITIFIISKTPTRFRTWIVHRLPAKKAKIAIPSQKNGSMMMTWCTMWVIHLKIVAIQTLILVWRQKCFHLSLSIMCIVGQLTDQLTQLFLDLDDSHYKKKRRSRKTPGTDLASRRGRGRGRGRRNNNKSGDCDTPRSSAKRANRQSGITSMQSSSNSPLNINEDSQSQLLLPVETQQPPPPIEYSIPETKNPIVAAIEKRWITL